MINSFNVIRDNALDIVDGDFVKNLRERLGYTDTVFGSIFGYTGLEIILMEKGQLTPMEKKMFYLIDKEPILIKHFYKIESN